MRPPEIRLFENEIIVDNFAGGGGASVGIEWALGRSPDIAINHDAQAVAMHQANHPKTKHFTEDVWDVDPKKVCGGRPVGLMWASPDCKHFSKAKGGKPVSKKIRGLAWIVVKWAKLVKPRVIMLENVEEFQTWGPLGDDDRPDKLKKGLTFQRWKKQLENLGYKVEFREVIAADYGAPTTRKRLFLVARRDGRPIIWPTPSHDQHGRYGLPKWRAAAECIDWSLPCHSIFLTNEEAKQYGVKRPLAENTMKRIYRGIQKFVINNPKPFIVGMAHGEFKDGSGGARVRSIDEPITTIHAGGNNFAVVAPHVAKFRGDSSGSAIESPMPTITAGPKENPAGAAHALGIIAPVLSALYGDKGAVDSAGRCQDLQDPLPTQTGDPRFALVAPVITEHANATNPRSWSADEPLRTQCAEVKGGHFALIAPTLIQTGYGEREGQAPRAPGLDKPLGTVVAGGAKHALVAAFMAQHNGGFYDTNGGAGRGVDQPMSTITHAGSNQNLVASSIVKFKGTSLHGQQMDLPLATVQAEGQHYAKADAFLIAYYGNEKDGQPIDEAMRTLTARDRLGLVKVEGDWYRIEDIGMRMLVPPELYMAQGFPADYKINIEFNGKPLPKDAQVRMCGNSVSPYPCAALVAAQFAQQDEEVAA